MELLMEYMGKGFVTMLMISMPCVLTAAGIGLIVGIIQAVTQVQEQTIAAAPKIFAVFLVIMICGFSYVRMLSNLLTEGTHIAFNVMAKQDNFVLPANYYKYTKPFNEEFKSDGFNNQPTINDLMKEPGGSKFLNGDGKLEYNPADRQPNPRPNFIEARKIHSR